MNNSLISNARIEEESIKIYNKFIDYVNTILTDKNNYTEIERNQIIQSVLSKIFIAYSLNISN